MSIVDLDKELDKAAESIAEWPDWKKTVLRDSMRGRVLTPREPVDSSDCQTKHAPKAEAKSD